MQQRSLDALRVNGRGRYLPHRAGLTHVIEEGQDDQPAMLLVHGATVPAWEFDRLIPHLRAAGWRTIRFDLFGHGLSDRPAVRYDFSFFLEQALEVLDGINPHRKAIDNNKFNSMVIATLGETTRVLNRIPNEDEFNKSFNNLLALEKGNLNQSQFNAIKSCTISLRMSFGDELLPLLKKLNIEIPQGGRTSYDEIFKIMCSRGILFDENALDFLKKYQ